MISHISRILEAFRPCFARQAAYHWFTVVVPGFMVRIDQCGVSSFVRWLGIEPSLYTALLSFFRAKSWQLSTIMHRWWKIVLERCSPITIDGRLVLAGDGIKIEVGFKVLNHVIGVFFYRFWTHVWPRIGKASNSDLSTVQDQRGRRLIADAADAIEAFVNFGCIATGILQILALNFHETIWRRYMGWLRTVSSSIPSEEVVRSVVQQEYYHNFRAFSTDAIYRIIMSKNRGPRENALPLAA